MCVSYCDLLSNKEVFVPKSLLSIKCTLVIMRSYFIRVPKWARLIYPSAIWSQADLDDEHDGALWTIDDGPDPESTPRWLALLDHMGTKAIFFLLGAKCEKHPELVEAIRSAGHRVASHGYQHLDGWKTDYDVYVEDARLGIEISDASYFRPAYGRMTRRQYKEISKLADIMMWSVMPGDFDQSVSKETMSHRLDLVKQDDIVVLHDDISSFHKCRHHLPKAILSY